MYWKRFTIGLIVLILLLSVVAGCKESAKPTVAPATPTATKTAAPATPTTAPGTPTVAPATPTTAPATPAPVKPMVLKFGSWYPPGIPAAVAADWYLIEAEKRSGGRIKFERYWAEALAPGKELLDALDAGIADVAILLPSYYPGKVPLATVGGLSYYLTDDIWTSFMAFNDLYAQVPAMNEELAKYKSRFLAPVGTAPYFVLTKRPVKTLADLKGLKLRASASEAVLMKELGAVPVSIVAPELFTALERGTVDGAVMGPSALTSYKLEEVAKNYLLLPAGGYAYMLGIRDATWKKISADLQQMMLDLAKESVPAYRQIYQIDGDKAGLEKMKAAGVTINTPSAEDIAKIRELANAAITAVWIADNAARGLPGQLVYDTYANLIKKYELLNPYKK